MADVFISYDHADRATAERVAHALTVSGMSVFWDRQILAGVKFNAELRRQITAARTVIVLWSRASQDSDWVHEEASFARDANKLVPLRIDGTLPPLGFGQVQSLDLQGWNGDPEAGTFQTLLSSLHRFFDEPAAATTVAPPERSVPSRWISKNRWVVATVALIVVSVIAYVLVQSRITPRTLETNNGGVEIGIFTPVTKTAELVRAAKGVTDAVVRTLTNSDIKAIASANAGLNLRSSAEFGLRGTVDRDGEQLVVNAELVHKQEGVVLWSTAMRRDAAQARILDNQFAASVGSVLQCGVRLRENARNDPSTDLLHAFVRFCAAIFEGRSDQLPEIARRIVEIAPNDAVSYALRAVANATVSNSDISFIEKSADEKALLRKLVYDDARIAERMDPTVDSYYARAIVDDPAVGFAEREQLLKKSIDLRPNGFGPPQYGELLRNVGRMQDALGQFERAAGANPLISLVAIHAAVMTGWLGDMERARKRFDDARSTEPDVADYWQFWTEYFVGDPAVARRINESYATHWIGAAETPLWGSDPCGLLFLDVREQRLRPSKAQMDAACPNGDLNTSALMGDVETALHIWESEPPGWHWLLFAPHNRLLRADPRFMQLAARFGLVDYWLDADQWPDFCKEEKLPYDCKEAARAARASASPASGS